MKGQESKAPSPGSHSIPILTASPIRAPLPKAEGWVSMTTEVRELLSWAVLDTSGQCQGFHPKETRACDLSHTSTPGRFPKRWIHPPNWAAQMKAKWTTPPQRRSLPLTPLQSKPQGPAAMSLPLDIAHLQEEANNALGDWLAVKSSIDPCWLEIGFIVLYDSAKVSPKPRSSSRKQRISAPIPSGKQRPTVLTLSRKQKPIAQQPSGRWRLKELLKPVPFNSHMPKPFSILKKRPLKRRVKVNSTFFSPAKLPWKPVLLNLAVCC